MAQLVQWGGAPAALARDTELRGHAKRGARGAPCTSLASFPPPSPRATRFSSPIYALHPFRPYATSTPARLTRN